MADKEVRVKIIGDVSDITKKLDNLKKELKDIASTLDKASSGNTFDKTTRGLQDLQDEIQDTEKRVEELDDSLERLDDGDLFNKSNKGAESLRKTVKETDKALEDLNNTNLKKTRESFEEFTDDGKEARGIFGKLGDIFESVKGKVGDFGSSLKVSTDGGKTGILEIVTAMNSYQGTLTDTEKEIKKYSSSYKDLISDMDKYNKKISELKTENTKIISEMIELDDIIKKFGDSTGDLANEFDFLGKKLEANEDDIEGLGNVIKKIEERINNLQKEMSSTAFDKMQKDIEKANKSTEELGNSFKDMFAKLKSGDFEGVFESLKNGMSSVTDTFSKVLSGDFKGALDSLKNGFSGVFNALPTQAKVGAVAIASVTTAIKKCAELGINQLKKGLNTLGTVFGKIGDIARSFGNELKNAFENITGVNIDLSSSIEGVVEFDYAIARAGSTCRASEKDMQLLEDKARQLGSETKFSATEVADAFYYMALAGWDVESMVTAVDDVLSLANVSGMDLAETCDIVTDYLSTFGMSARDASDFINHLAVTSTITNTTVSQLAEAYKNCASIASEFGVSQMFLNTQLGILANSGNKGSTAGTVLKNMYANLLSPSNDKAMKMFEEMGIYIDGELNPALYETNQITGEQTLAEQKLNDELREEYKNLETIGEKSEFLKNIYGKESLAGGAILMGASDFEYEEIELGQKVSDNFGSYIANQYGLIDKSTGKLVNSNGELIKSEEDLDESTKKSRENFNKLYDVYEQAVDSQVADILGVSNAELGSAIMTLGEDGKVSAKNVSDFANVLMAIKNPSDKVKKALKENGIELKDFQGALVYAEDGSLNLSDSLDNLVPMLAKMDKKSRDALLTQMGLGDSIDEVDELVNNQNKSWREHEKAIEESMTATQTMEEYFSGTFQQKMMELSSAWSEFWNSLLLPMKDIITKILDEFTQFFQTLGDIIKGKKNWNDLLEITDDWQQAISDGLHGIIKKIDEFVNGGGLDTVLKIGTRIVQGICDGITRAKEDGSLGRAISGTISKIATWFNDNIDDVIQVGIDILDAICKGIEENSDVIGEAIVKIINGQTEIDSKISGAKWKFIGEHLGEFVWTGIKSFLDPKIAALLSFAEGLDMGGTGTNKPLSEEEWRETKENGGNFNLFNLGERGGNSFSEGFGNGLNNNSLGGSVSDNLEEGKDQTDKTSSEIGESITENIVNGMSNLNAEGIKDLQTELTNLQTTVETVATGMSTSFETMRNNLRTSFTGITGIVRTQMVNCSNIAKNQCSNMAQSFRTEFVNISNIVKTQMTNVSNTIRTEAVNWSNIIRNQITNARNQFTSQMISMANVARTQMVNVSNVIRTQAVNWSNIVKNQITNARNSFTQQMISMRNVASTQATLIRTVIVEKFMSIQKVIATQISEARDTLTSKMISMRKVTETQMSQIVSVVRNYMSQIKALTSQQFTMRFKVDRTITTTNVTKSVQQGMANTMASMNTNMRNVGRPNVMSSTGLSNGTVIDMTNAFGGNLALEVPLILDGKEIARASATYNRAELSKLEKRNKRQRGE